MYDLDVFVVMLFFAMGFVGVFAVANACIKVEGQGCHLGGLGLSLSASSVLSQMMNTRNPTTRTISNSSRS